MEKELINEILLEAAKKAGQVVLFRNNTGQGFQGEVVAQSAETITLRNYRRVKYGLVKGGTDTAGWTEVEITPEMVGQTIAVFTAIEAKTGDQKAKKHQQHFIDRVNDSGGIAGVARTAQEASSIIENRVEDGFKRTQRTN